MWMLLLLGCHEAFLVRETCTTQLRQEVALDDTTPVGTARALADGVSQLRFAATLHGEGPVPSSVLVEDPLSLTYVPHTAHEVVYTGETTIHNVTCATGPGIEIEGTLSLRSTGGLDLEGPAILVAIHPDPARAWLTSAELAEAGPAAGAYAQLADDFPCASGPRAPLRAFLHSSPDHPFQEMTPTNALGVKAWLGVTSSCQASDTEHQPLLQGTVRPAP